VRLDSIYTGVITTTKTLDREAVADFHLNVVVRDGGGLSCRSQVHIVLTDVNDNAPVFTSGAQYAATVLENADIGTGVVRVVAVDPDIGINRRVRYALEGDSARGVFSVDAVSGVLTLLQPLDREDHPFYNVTVIAIDQVIKCADILCSVIEKPIPLRIVIVVILKSIVFFLS
jgi:protocadherin Fat 1/2/3